MQQRQTLCVFNKYKDKRFAPAWLFWCIIVVFALLCCFLYLTLELQSVKLHFFPRRFTAFALEREDRRSDLKLDFVSPFALSFVLILRCHQK